MYRISYKDVTTGMYYIEYRFSWQMTGLISQLLGDSLPDLSKQFKIVWLFKLDWSFKTFMKCLKKEKKKSKQP